MSATIIRVLVVDDMRLIRQMLKAILESDSEIKVVGMADNGKDGIALAEKLKPDVIIMDLHMPVMDGIMATRYLMQYCPTPILIMSSSSIISERNATFEALQIGALEVMEKPDGSIALDLKTIGAELIHKVKRFSRVRVIRHVANLTKPTPALAAGSLNPQPASGYKLVAIGASTGGPVALITLLAHFPADFPVPVVVVQHISASFVEGLGEWMAKNVALAVVVAKDREKLTPQKIYLAPSLAHLTVTSGLQVCLTQEPKDLFNIPSVNVLFHSVAQTVRDRAIGVLLTGMGDDGAQGLGEIRKQGGRTFAQDKESCVIFGMPQKALKLGAVLHTSSLPAIANEILMLCTAHDANKI